MKAALVLADAHYVDMDQPTEFADLYERHYAAVYRAALRVTGNPADAEDVLQTVFLRVLNQGGRLNISYAQEAYFRRAAINGSLDLLRRRTSHNETPFDEATDDRTTESKALLKSRLRQALAAINHDDAIMFLLRYIEGLDNGEIAEMYGQEKNNIAVRLHRIRQTLKDEMER
jgi:RNA polymerase sigma factor (sigma-70 family)